MIRFFRPLVTLILVSLTGILSIGCESYMDAPDANNGGGIGNTTVDTGDEDMPESDPQNSDPTTDEDSGYGNNGNDGGFNN